MYMFFMHNFSVYIFNRLGKKYKMKEQLNIDNI